MEKLEEAWELTVEENVELIRSQRSIEEIYKKEEVIWRQRAHIKWLKEADVNTALFS